MHGTITYIHGAIPLPFCSPLLASPLSPLCVPFYLLGLSSCDRNRPPRSQVACKLTPFDPPFTQPTPSLQIPRTLTAPRLTKTTSGIFLLLLSATSTMQITIWGSVLKDSITGCEIKNNIYVHSPRVTGSGLGCSRISTTLSRSIHVESY